MNTIEAVGAYKKMIGEQVHAEANDLPDINTGMPKATLTNDGELAVMEFNFQAFGKNATLDKTVCLSEAEGQAENFLREEMATIEIPSNQSVDRQTHLLRLAPEWFTWSV
jgi:hypothetical protein